MIARPEVSCHNEEVTTACCLAPRFRALLEDAAAALWPKDGPTIAVGIEHNQTRICKAPVTSHVRACRYHVGYRAFGSILAVVHSAARDIPGRVQAQTPIRWHATCIIEVHTEAASLVEQHCMESVPHLLRIDYE